MRIILLIMIGLSLLQADYIRDDTKQVVLDSSTNLMWQDDNDSKTITQTWSAAITYCEAKTLGGFSDWRVPNKNELYLLADKNTSNPAISSVFQNVISSLYWSSTTYAPATTGAWGVYFSLGDDDAYDKTNTYYVRCVR